MPRTQSVAVTTFDDLLKYIATTDAPFAHSLWSKAILSLTSLASTWMYVVPSMKAGEREQGEAGKWLQLFGNTSCAALVVFNIGGHYIGLLETAQDKAKLLTKNPAFGEIKLTETSCHQTFIQKLKKNQLHILILAGLTATPLAAAAWFYKDWDAEPTALLGAKTGVTFGVYTLIHTLPISLILNVNWLNFLLVKVPKFVLTFPIIVGKSAYQHLCTKNYRPVPDEAERELQQNIALRTHVVNALYALVEQFKTTGFTKSGCCHTPLPLAGTLENLIAPHTEETDEESLLPQTTTPTSLVAQCGHFFYAGWRNLFGAAGSLLVGASIFGYLKVNYNLFYALLEGSTFGALALIAGPAIVSEVLCMYYGQRAFSLAYDYLTSCLAGKGQMPYAFKLNFGVSSLFLGVTYFLNYFSYGTALQLTHDTCEPDVYGQFACTLLEFASKWGIIVYGCINLAELVEKLVEPVALRFGSKEQKQFVKALNDLKRLAALIDQLDPNCFKKLLATIDKPELLSALKLVKNEDGTVSPKTATKPEALPKKTSGWCDWCCFWRSPEESAPSMQSANTLNS